MEISRRDFLKYVGASALAMGLSQLHLDALDQALASASAPPVIWLSGSSCTGCSISLLNAVNPTIDQVLTQTISLRYHPNLMAAAGDLAVSAARSLVPASQSAHAPAPVRPQAGNYQVYLPIVAGGQVAAQTSDYILIVEGAVPTASHGRYCYVWDEGGRSVTMAEAVTSLAVRAKHIIAVGTCASFGGIPAAYVTTGATGLGAFLNKPVINLPGCPAHPDWIIGSLALLLGGTVPALDSYQRPTVYYTPR